MNTPKTVIRLCDVECTPSQARCTCPLVWHAIVPPPRCPVHGQSHMQIIC